MQTKLKAKFSRRGLLKNVAVAGASAFAAGSLIASQRCLPTAPQTEGPFYPVTPRLDSDADLTLLPNSAVRAAGRQFLLSGVITDLSCTIVPGAVVEIWQACASGKYDHPGDTNPAVLDSKFQYWGKTVSGVDGSYVFRTIVPGAYPASSGWTRPPHIHFRVTAPGSRPFTTQMYFAEFEELNIEDRILSGLRMEQRKAVIVELRAPSVRTSTLNPENLETAEFNIVLNLSGNVKHTPELD